MTDAVNHALTLAICKKRTTGLNPESVRSCSYLLRILP